MPEAANAELDDRRLRLWIRTAMLLYEKRKEKDVVDSRGGREETRVLRFAPILLPDTNFF